MTLLAVEKERTNFSQRLKSALTGAGFLTGPSNFAKEYNLRAPNGAVVTVHAVRKWLLGESIPTQPRIQIIADWLGVSAAWLRFGESGNSAVHSVSSASQDVSPSDLSLLYDIRTLSKENLDLLHRMISVLLQVQQQIHQAKHPLRSGREGPD